MGPTPKPLEKRYKIDKNGCWIWQDSKSERNYGLIRVKNKLWKAHRYFYWFYRGKFDLTLEVCHKCDITLCVNPDHLFLGTHQENMSDMVKKNRTVPPRGENQGNSKLTTENVLEIRKRFSDGEKCGTLAKDFKVSDTNIRYIVNGKAWTHV